MVKTLDVSGLVTMRKKMVVVMSLVIIVENILTQNVLQIVGSQHKDGWIYFYTYYTIISCVYKLFILIYVLCCKLFRYHVPRSYLKDGANNLVLFAELGGNPSQVNFQTVVVGTVCANAYENKTLELSCQGRKISAIKFASFGDPEGVCGAFTNGSCESKSNALSIVQKVIKSLLVSYFL